MTIPKPASALVGHAHGRTQQILKRLRDAMKAIEIEIEQNEGIYPFNGGRLSLSEVCRRAGVHKVTLQGSLHRDSSKVEIEQWIKSIKSRLITGRKTVRKTVTARADNWELMYRGIANKFNEMYAIEITGRNGELATLRARVLELESENLTLRTDLSKGKIVRMPTRSRGKLARQKNASEEPTRLILIRGLPGSGKSTLAKSFEGYTHFEADMFFEKDGKYLFDSALLSYAHKWCLEQVKHALSNGMNVVVSNVFATEFDVKQYVDLGVIYKIVEAKGKWRSVHQLPLETISRMRSEWVPQSRVVAAMSAYVEQKLLQGK